MIHKIRMTAALLTLAVLAVVAIPRSVAMHHASSAVATVSAAPSHLPAPAPLPFDVVAFGAVAGATSLSKKNKNLIVDSIIHVARKNDAGHPVTQTIAPGTLVTDTDLTADEIDEHVARKSVRYATSAELDQLERVASEKAAAAVAAGVDHETAAINAEGDVERQRIIAEADAAKNKQLAELDEKLAKDRQDAATKAADDAKKNGGKKGKAATAPATPPGSTSVATDPGSESARAEALSGTPTTPALTPPTAP